MSNAEKQAAFRARRDAYVKGLERKLRNQSAAVALTSKQAKNLEVYLDTLFGQGCASAATIAPAVIMHAIVNLERLLVDLGIAPKGARYSDAKAYARKAKRLTRSNVDPELVTDQICEYIQAACDLIDIPGNWPVEIDLNRRKQAFDVLISARSKALEILTIGYVTA
jgi:hypothetical protein